MLIFLIFISCLLSRPSVIGDTEIDGVLHILIIRLCSISYEKVFQREFNGCWKREEGERKRRARREEQTTQSVKLG